ncbi:MAG: HisA/HisF-related TIM barrel protein [Myxococcaceae bacterium]
MKALPAIDLREGACVQLVGGSYDQERVRLPDPLAVAERFAALGFSQLHVVDLDAATGRGSNSEVVRSLLGLRQMNVQVGGGLRSTDDVKRVLDWGAARTVVGTRAIEEPTWLEGVAAAFPNRLVVAADVRGEQVVTRGWEKTLALSLGALLQMLAPLPLAGVLVTAVHQEGQLTGPDVALMTRAVTQARLPLYASGGVRSVDDLRALEACGVAGAVIGMALYTGTMNAAEAAREFG